MLSSVIGAEVAGKAGESDLYVLRSWCTSCCQLYSLKDTEVVSIEWTILPGFNFIIKEWPSVLILFLANQIINDSLYRSYKFIWCLCRFIGKLYILLLTILINSSEICKNVHEILWIKLKERLNDYEIKLRSNSIKKSGCQTVLMATE